MAREVKSTEGVRGGELVEGSKATLNGYTVDYQTNILAGPKGVAESRAMGELSFKPWAREVHQERGSVISRADHFRAFMMVLRR